MKTPPQTRVDIMEADTARRLCLHNQRLAVEQIAKHYACVAKGAAQLAKMIEFGGYETAEESDLVEYVLEMIRTDHIKRLGLEPSWLQYTEK